MGLFTWGKGFVADLESARVRAEKGAAWLDKKLGPGWERCIDLERLDIFSPRHCVLGQLIREGRFLFITPWSAIRKGFGCGVVVELLALIGIRSKKAVRCYGLLTEAWRALIVERLEAQVTRPSLCVEEKTWKRQSSIPRCNRIEPRKSEEITRLRAGVTQRSPVRRNRELVG